MKITKESGERPFSAIEKGSVFERNGKIHMRLDRDYHMKFDNGIAINAVDLERGKLEHFDKNEFVKICNADLIVAAQGEEHKE